MKNLQFSLIMTLMFLRGLFAQNVCQLPTCTPIPGNFPYIENSCIAPIERYLGRTVGMVYLVDENTPGNSQYNPQAYCENIQTTVDINASFIAIAAGVWGGDIGNGGDSRLKPGTAYWSAMKSLVKDINRAYDCANLARPIIQAKIYESITDESTVGLTVSQIKIPIDVISAFIDEMNSLDKAYYLMPDGVTPKTNIKFNFYNIKGFYIGGGIDGIQGTDDDNYCPDIVSKIEAKMWVYYLAKSYIDAGYHSIALGQIEFFIGLNYQPLTPACSTNMHSAYTLCTKIRNYAISMGTFVLISAETYRNYYDNNDQNTLVFDFNTIAARPREVQNPMSNDQNQLNCTYTVSPILFNNTPCDAFLCIGSLVKANAVIDPCHRSFVDNSDGGVNPLGCYYAKIPYIIEYDFGGYFGHDCLTASYYNGIERCWGYEDVEWFKLLSDDCQAYWLSKQMCRVRQFQDGQAFLEMPGRLTGYSPFYRLNEHPLVKQAVINSWAVNIPSFTATKHCPATGGLPWYQLNVNNTDCSSIYSIHIQKPNLSWEPITYSTYKTYYPNIGGNYKFQIRQDNMGLPPSYLGSQTLTLNQYVVYCEPTDERKIQAVQEELHINKVLLNIFPQPVTNQLHLQLSILYPVKIEINVYDLNGIKIYNLLNQESFEKGLYSEEFNISDIPSGMYFIRVEYSGMSKHYKFIKL